MRAFSLELWGMSPEGYVSLLMTRETTYVYEFLWWLGDVAIDSGRYLLALTTMDRLNKTVRLVRAVPGKHADYVIDERGIRFIITVDL